MKKSLLIILSFTMGSAFAQIPNAGFELVTTMTGMCNTGGATLAAPTYYYTGPNPTATTTVAHSGTKAAMVSTYNGQAESLITLDCNGFQPYAAYTGIIPGSMTAWIRRATAMSNDTLTITAAVYDNASNPLSGGSLQVTGAGYTSYTQVTIPMSVVGTGTAAKLLIAMSGCVVAGSTWYVDDLAFQPVGIQTYSKDSYDVWYNSLEHKVEIKSSKDENVQVCVYDISGKKVIGNTALQVSNGSSAGVSTEGLTQGIYFVQLMNASGVISTKKVVVQ